MRRSVIVSAVILSLAVALGLYRMEYLIRDMEQRLAQVNREVLQSHQAIQVLEAEWSYLNQPNRLQRLAENYLELVPLLPSQIGLIGDIPLRNEKFDFAAIVNIRPRLASAATRTEQSTGKRAQTRSAKATSQKTNGQKTIGRKLAAGRNRVNQND